MVRRPKPKKDRSIDAKLDGAITKRDEWMRALTTATHKVRYYVKRIDALNKKARTTPSPAGASRAIRLR